MDKPLLIILAGLAIGALLGAGLYIATLLGFTPVGEDFNNFFTMVGVIIFFISGFFLISMKTLQTKT
jgi:hypothetical protein